MHRGAFWRRLSITPFAARSRADQFHVLVAPYLVRRSEELGFMCGECQIDHNEWSMGMSVGRIAEQKIVTNVVPKTLDTRRPLTHKKHSPQLGTYKNETPPLFRVLCDCVFLCRKKKVGRNMDLCLLMLV